MGPQPPKIHVAQHCPQWRQHHVPGDGREDGERGDQLRAKLYEGEDHCTTRKEALYLDWGLHSGLSVHFQTDDGHQGGV